MNTNTIAVNGTPVDSWQALAEAIKGTEVASPEGDINCFAFANSLAGHILTTDNGGVKLTFGMICDSFNVRVSQYQKGIYPVMIFGLPAAALAMIASAPKVEGRKTAFSAVIGSALASAITGITEPIEFTFLFLSPALYYGFHGVIAGVSY